ncbi:Protein EI24-like protein [Zea mays]|nr:Protein EI24-like protein [Zea mays]
MVCGRLRIIRACEQGVTIFCS